MAWLKVDQDLRDHRKLLEAADILDMEPVHLMGHLISLWLWSLSNIPDGNIGNLTKRTIARAAQWKGDPDELIDALVEVRLLDKTEDGLFIHDWDDYAGALIRKREEDRERAKRNREKKKVSSDDTRSVREPSADELETSVVRVEEIRDREEEIREREEKRESNEGAPSDSNCNQLLSDDFNRFWEVYPRKVGERQAFNEWKKINPDPDLANAIIASVERWKQSEQWTDDGGQFIPYPASFLAKERWKDDCQPAIKQVPFMKSYDDDEDFLGGCRASP